MKRLNSRQSGNCGFIALGLCLAIAGGLSALENAKEKDEFPWFIVAAAVGLALPFLILKVDKLIRAEECAQRICPKCGAERVPALNYCPSCGNPLP